MGDLGFQSGLTRSDITLQEEVNFAKRRCGKQTHDRMAVP